MNTTADRLKLRAIKGFAKQFLPEIQDNAAPYIEDILAGIINDAESRMVLGESYAALTLQRRAGKMYVCVCLMSDTNQVVRTLEMITMQELITMLLTKFEML